MGYTRTAGLAWYNISTSRIYMMLLVKNWNSNKWTLFLFYKFLWSNFVIKLWVGCCWILLGRISAFWFCTQSLLILFLNCLLTVKSKGWSYPVQCFGMNFNKTLLFGLTISFWTTLTCTEFWSNRNIDLSYYLILFHTFSTHCLNILESVQAFGWQ